MRESDDFAKAYAGAERKFKNALPKASEIFEEPQNLKKAEIFERGMEFDEAVGKISEELLRIFQSQFHSTPLKFVKGGIVEEREFSQQEESEYTESSIVTHLNDSEEYDD